MLLDGHRRKDAAVLRHEGNARFHDPVRRQPRDVGPVEDDAAAPCRRQSQDRAQRRRFARSVSPENRDALRGSDRETDALQDVAFTVIGVNVLDLKHGAAPDTLRSLGDWTELVLGSCRQHLAVIQHRDDVADRKHDIHVVFDEKDGQIG